MSKEEVKKQRGEDGYKLHQEIVEREEMRRRLFAQNIEDLNHMQEDKLYQDVLGDDEANWEAYLGQIEVFYPRSKVQRWRRIFNKIVNRFNINLVEIYDIPETRLDDIGSVVETKDDLEEALRQARVLPTSLEWRNFIADLKGEPTSEQCEHNYNPWQICSKCGMRHKVDTGNEHEHKEV